MPLLWPILVLAALAYAPAVVLNGYVQWDDGLLFVHNPVVQAFTLSNIRAIFTSYDPEIYIPFTLLTYQLEYAIFGAIPVVSHALNLLLHLANIFLVWGVLKRFASNQVAWTATLLWAVHPLNVETVIWASARKDLLSACFALLTILLYDRGRKLAVLPFVLSCLSKPGAIALPPALLLLDLLRGKALSKLLIPLFGVSVLFGLIALGAPGNITDLAHTLMVFPKAFLLPLVKIFVPYPLSPVYAYAGEPLWPWTIALVALAVASLASIRRTHVILMGLLWYGVTILPNLLKRNPESAYITADHYAYLPSVGIIVLIACVLARLPRSGSIVWIVALALAFLTHWQSLLWRGTDTLFLHVVRHYDNSSLAYANVAHVYFQDKDFAKAEEHLRKSLAVRPNSLAYYRLGEIAIERGDLAAAEGFLRQAVEARTFLERPQDLYADMGAVLLLRNNPEAVTYLTKALEIEPGHEQAQYNLQIARQR